MDTKKGEPRPPAQHSTDGESGRFTMLQPREITFDVASTLDGRFSEGGHPRFEGRRGFKPSQKLHNTNITRHVKSAQEGDEGSNKHRESLNRLSVNLNMVSSPFTEEASASPNTKTGTATNRVARRANHDPIEARKQRSRAIMQKGQRPTVSLFGTLTPQDLHIEGNSVLVSDSGQAAQSLHHLSLCVATERRLREELEAAKEAKLDAFRSVIKIFLLSCSGDGDEHHRMKSLDALSLARCSVITNTLTQTIQSYLRSCYSRQLVTALRNMRRRMTHKEADHSSWTLSMRSEKPEDRTARSPSEAASHSLEEMLDMQEINKLKQLYFDYFDCEVVSISTPVSTSPPCEPGDCASQFASTMQLERAESSFSNTANTTM